jgi:glycosyltransferase involved in cell wall biosynthesis
MPQELLPFGLNVIGYASANLGLGIVLRQYVTCFIERGINVRILDLDAGSERSKFDNRFQSLTVEHAKDLPYAVNLYIISALSLSNYALNPPKGLQINDRLNVAFPWWELTDIPLHWSDASRVFDALITGSDFVRNTFSTHVPGVPILTAPHPVHIPNTVIPNRSRFQLPEDVFLVYTGFEPHSDPSRKNPFSAVEAFKQAFPNRADCHLVIKVNNAYDPSISGKRLALLESMYASINSDARIHLIQENLPYDDLLSLYASCDVFISLHRSEGLGLVPLEAMRLGKPVVATAWSGNMSYMNYLNSCLVSFEFIGIGDSHFYSKENLGINGFWAEPDVNQAAAWLKKLADDSLFRLQLGLRAATDTKRYHEQASRVDFVDELKAICESRAFLPQRDREPIIKQARESMRRFEYEKYLSKMNPFERFARNIKKVLDRYLLWRFRKVEI